MDLEKELRSERELETEANLNPENETQAEEAAEEVSEVQAEETAEKVCEPEYVEEKAENEKFVKTVKSEKDVKPEKVGETKKGINMQYFLLGCIAILLIILIVVIVVDPGKKDDGSGSDNQTTDISGTGATGSTTTGLTETETVASVIQIPENVDYSAPYTEKGLLKDVATSEYIELLDYKVIKIDESAATPSESDIETEIDNLKALIQDELLTDADLEIKSGDTVHIDYVGYVDGVAFEGGDTKGNGATLEIGSHTYIDTFEDQLIGHKPGENVKVEVTFPDPYTNNTDLSGKAAVFEVVVNGIYYTPELNDEYIATNFPEYGSTYADMVSFITDKLIKNNITTQVTATIVAESNMVKIPENLKSALVESELVYQDYVRQQYNYMYYMYYGYAPWSTMDAFVTDMYGLTPEEFLTEIDSMVEYTAKFELICQAIAEAEGITVTEEDVDKYLADAGYSETDKADIIETYGKNYLMMETLDQKVIDYLIENCAVIDTTVVE